MAKLTGAKKKAFLERMAKGRKKAARKNPRKATKKAKRTPKKHSARNKPAKKKARKNPKRPHGSSWATQSGAPRGLKIVKQSFPCGHHHRSVAAYRACVLKSGKTKPNPRRKGKRRNSEEQDAAAMFETFHQMPPRRTIDYEEMVKYPHHFAEIGRPLKELRVFLDSANPDFPFTRFGDCQVVCTPDGTNIYFVGGDQAIDLAGLDLTSDKDTIELGPCTYISYHTIKGFHDFEPTDYWHRFGEEDGVFPRLGYDQLNKRLFLIGGNYQVKREGIVN